MGTFLPGLGSISPDHPSLIGAAKNEPLFRKRGEFLFIAIRPSNRVMLATTIENLINALDEQEVDCDFEGDDDEDLDRVCSHRRQLEITEDHEDGDDREDENEHGGDIQDEPHDLDADVEADGGWRTHEAQRGVGVEGWSQCDDTFGGAIGFQFDGSGIDVAERLIRAKVPLRLVSAR